MVWDIVMGTEKDNIITSIRKSRIKMVLLLIVCIEIYKSGLCRGADGLFGIILAGVLGVMLMNCMYIPVRFLGSRSINVKTKMMFVLSAVVVALYYMNTASVENSASLMAIVAKIIIIPLAVLGIGAVIRKKSAVHAQTYRSVCRKRAFDKMDGWEFEAFCAQVLRSRGFQNVAVTSGSGDYGIDIIAYKGGLKYGIQVKRYEGAVGWHAVEEARAGAEYWGCNRAVVLTNSHFTKQALEGAPKIGVALWDREVLEQML